MHGLKQHDLVRGQSQAAGWAQLTRPPFYRGNVVIPCMGQKQYDLVRGRSQAVGWTQLSRLPYGNNVDGGHRGYPQDDSPTNLALGPLLVGSGHPAWMSRHTAQAGFFWADTGACCSPPIWFKGTLRRGESALALFTFSCAPFCGNILSFPPDRLLVMVYRGNLVILCIG